MPQNLANEISNGLVPSGNKPLPEPILTHISVAIYGVFSEQMLEIYI